MQQGTLFWLPKSSKFAIFCEDIKHNNRRTDNNENEKKIKTHLGG